MKRMFTLSALAVLAFTLGLGAQAKPSITRADYGQWESLSAGGGRGGGGGGGFSPDGRFVAYAITRTSRSNELRVLKLADNTTKVAPFGAQPTFSSDSKWLAYSIGYSEAEQERLRTAQRPIQNRLGLLNLRQARRRRSTVLSRSPSALTARTWRCGATAQPPAAAAGGAPAAGGGGGRRRRRRRRTPTNRSAPRSSSGNSPPAARRPSATSAEFAWQDADHSHLAGHDDQRRGQDRQRRAALRSGDDRAARARLVADRLHRSRLADGLAGPGGVASQDR